MSLQSLSGKMEMPSQDYDAIDGSENQPQIRKKKRKEKKQRNVHAVNNRSDFIRFAFIQYIEMLTEDENSHEFHTWNIYYSALRATTTVVIWRDIKAIQK